MPAVPAVYRRLSKLAGSVLCAPTSLVTKLILFCCQFTPKDQCKKVQSFFLPRSNVEKIELMARPANHLVVRVRRGRL